MINILLTPCYGTTALVGMRDITVCEKDVLSYLSPLRVKKFKEMKRIIYI